MDPRHRQAIKRTLIAALVCSIPLSLLLYGKWISVEPEGLTSDYELKPFYFEDSTGKGFTNANLTDRLTIVLADRCSSDCTANRQTLKDLESDALKKLRYDLYQSDAVKVVLLTQETDPMAAKSLYPTSWQVVNLTEKPEEELKVIFPSTLIDSDSPLMAVLANSSKALFATKIEKDSIRPLKKVLSRLNFNSLLDEYLSERTFFGPKRKVSQF